MVVVDEASQATEPATLVPLTRGAHCAVLAGDPRQVRARARRGGAVLEEIWAGSECHLPALPGAGRGPEAVVCLGVGMEGASGGGAWAGSAICPHCVCWPGIRWQVGAAHASWPGAARGGGAPPRPRFNSGPPDADAHARARLV